jgi:hypothetical protein
MSSPGNRIIVLLMAMSLTLLPLPGSATSDLPDLSADDPCESSSPENCEAETCDIEQSSEDDDCCETGCQHCSLPCCTGTVMLPTVAQGLGPVPTTADHVVTLSNDLPWVDADPLFHPPRG